MKGTGALSTDSAHFKLKLLRPSVAQHEQHPGYVRTLISGLSMRDMCEAQPGPNGGVEAISYHFYTDDNLRIGERSWECKNNRNFEVSRLLKPKYQPETNGEHPN